MGLTKISGKVIKDNCVISGVVTASNFTGPLTGNVSAPTSLNVGVTTFHSTQGFVHNINSTGVITATSFSGDGSNLSGIDATQIQTGNTSVQTVDTGSDGHVKVKTEGTERVRINSSGNIGIGTEIPGARLEVNSGTSSQLIVKTPGANNTARATRLSFAFDDGEGAAVQSTRISGGSTLNCNLSFRTGGVTNSEERLGVGTDGNVSINNGNLVFSTAGTGIDFSATSGPAGMQSEILDDYEEGTFTPILSEGYTGISHGTGYPLGDYVKVGQLCHVSISFYFSSTGYQSTTRLKIEGLPFAGNSIAANFAGFLTYGFGNISLDNYNSLGWYIPNNQTYANQYAMNGPTGYNSYPNANASNHWIQVSGTYRVD